MIKELGIKFLFESIKGIAGDSYNENRMETIQQYNPMNYEDNLKSSKRRMTKADALAIMGIKS